MRTPTLAEILEIASFRYDDEGKLVVTMLNTDLIGNHFGDHVGNHHGNHVGMHIGDREGKHRGRHFIITSNQKQNEK